VRVLLQDNEGRIIFSKADFDDSAAIANVHGMKEMTTWSLNFPLNLFPQVCACICNTFDDTVCVCVHVCVRVQRC
jgi:hypothetical protein